MIIHQDGELIHKQEEFKELDLKLPPRAYAILVLREDFGWTWRKIAEYFKCSEISIKKYINQYV